MLETLRIVWAWWRDQLLDLVPGHAARRVARADDGLILSDPPTFAVADGGLAPLAPPGAAVWLVERQLGLDQPPVAVPLRPETTEPVRQSAARRRLPIVLRLPAGLLLEREVSLPLAAERELDRVLFHEIDRLTPFTAAELFWSWRLVARDRTHGRLALRLSLVPRAPIEPVLAGLRHAGLPVNGLELAGTDGAARRISLDHANTRPARPALLAAVAGVAALAVVAIALPFVMQSRAMAAADSRIAALTPIVNQVQALRRQAAAGSTGADAVAAERKRAGDALGALALLTDGLPDNTYLTALTYDAGRVTLDGQSQSAAALIAPLTANRQVQEASFTAPVVRNTLGADTFSMRLRVAP